MRGECCHYDEGYDEGFEDGKDDERGFERSDVVEALQVLSRERLRVGRYEEADLISSLADEIARDGSIENRVRVERERVSQAAKLYAIERAAA